MIGPVLYNESIWEMEAGRSGVPLLFQLQDFLLSLSLENKQANKKKKHNNETK